MSRPSPFRHPLAVLRTILGLSQEEFGKEIGLARRTIQAIELGKLRLTEENALKIQEATGASVHWLLGGDTTAKPYIDGDEFGGAPGKRRYTKEEFDQIKASKNSEWEMMKPEETPASIHITALATTADWLPIIAAAEKAGKGDLATYYMRKFLNEMREKFGWDDKTAKAVWGKAKVIEPDGKELLFSSDGMTYVKGGPGFRFRRKTKAESPKKP